MIKIYLVLLKNPIDMNKLKKNLEDGFFTLTAEITPPRGADFASLTAAAEILKPAVSAINLTDGAGAKVRMSSLAAAIYLKKINIEPILQVTCRDRNRIAIQADLLGAASFGINNVLALAGDSIESGEDKKAKGVFDLNSKDLLKVMQKMNKDKMTLSGAQLNENTNFFPAAADAPCDPSNEWKPDRLIEKYSSGARFIQTQYCYDMEILNRYMQRLVDYGLTEKLYFIIGLGPLRSAKGAIWMRDNLFGTIMPDNIIKRMNSSKNPRDEGIQICAELMQEASEIEGVSGAHLMAPGLYEETVSAVKLAGFIK